MMVVVVAEEGFVKKKMKNRKKNIKSQIKDLSIATSCVKYFKTKQVIKVNITPLMF